MKKMSEDLFCLLHKYRYLVYVSLPRVTSPSVIRDLKLAVFRPFLNLSLFSPGFLCLPHLTFYLMKHSLGTQISFFSLFLSLP